MPLNTSTKLLSKMLANVDIKFPNAATIHNPENIKRNRWVFSAELCKNPSRSGNRKAREIKQPATNTDNAVLATSKITAGPVLVSPPQLARSIAHPLDYARAYLSIPM